MLSGIRLKNFRSFKDTGLIKFRPITLFLGQNSSGKSSVLRSIPLIKQSIRTPSNAPVLWFGSEVDFGTIRDVRFDEESEGDVYMSFYFDHIGEQNIHRRTAWYYEHEVDLQEVELEIALGGDENETKLNGFSLKIQEEKIEIRIDKIGRVTSCKIGGDDFSEYFPKDKVRFDGGNIVPSLNYIQQKNKKSNYINFLYRRDAYLADARRAIFEFLQSRLHNNVSGNSISEIMNKVSFRPGRAFEDLLMSVNSDLQSWSKLKAVLKYDKSEINILKNLYLLADIPIILRAIESRMDSAFRNAGYVGPSRATGERYYRHQELAVDQIDSQGRNLAMFLSSLSSNQQNKFSDWLQSSIGSAMRINPSGGHIKIELRPTHAESWHNLADMGYGFSQILPVMAQIWFQQSDVRSGPKSPFIAIEQPELHLHPAYQGLLADIFTTSIANPRQGPLEVNQKFLIETHSEAFINRLGDLVANQKISENDIAIYVFNKTPNDEETNISKVSFDNHGSLVNWPVGFFSSRRI